MVVCRKIGVCRFLYIYRTQLLRFINHESILHYQNRSHKYIIEFRLLEYMPKLSNLFSSGTMPTEPDTLPMSGEQIEEAAREAAARPSPLPSGSPDLNGNQRREKYQGKLPDTPESESPPVLSDRKLPEDAPAESVANVEALPMSIGIGGIEGT